MREFQSLLHAYLPVRCRMVPRGPQSSLYSHRHTPWRANHEKNGATDKGQADAPSPSTVKQNRPTRCSPWSPSICSAPCPPFSSFSLTHTERAGLDPGAYARDMEVKDVGSSTLTQRHMLHALPLPPAPLTAHTGYQTGKHSGNRSHSLSRQQGEEQHDLTLPAQNETGKRLPGPGGWGNWAGTQGR